MSKRFEDMSQAEILREFEGATEFGHVPRRAKKMIPLTIRVQPRLVKELDAQAKLRGVSGHTTMARIILESSVRTSQRSLVDEIATAVVQKMRRKKFARA